MDGIKDQSPNVHGRARGRGRGVLAMIDRNGYIKPAFQTSPCPITIPKPLVSPVRNIDKSQPAAHHLQPQLNGIQNNIESKVCPSVSQPNDIPTTLERQKEPADTKAVHPALSPNHRFFNDVCPNRIIEEAGEEVKMKNRKKFRPKDTKIYPVEPIFPSIPSAPENQHNLNTPTNRFQWNKEQQAKPNRNPKDVYHWVKPSNQNPVKPATTTDKFHWTKDDQQPAKMKDTQTTPDHYPKETDYIKLQNPETQDAKPIRRQTKNDQYHWVKIDEPKQQKTATKESVIPPKVRPPTADQDVKKKPAINNEKKANQQQKKKKDHPDWDKEKEKWVAPENTVWSWYARDYVDITPMNINDSGIEKEVSSNDSDVSVKEPERLSPILENEVKQQQPIRWVSKADADPDMWRLWKTEVESGNLKPTDSFYYRNGKIHSGFNSKTRKLTKNEMEEISALKKKKASKKIDEVEEEYPPDEFYADKRSMCYTRRTDSDNGSYANYKKDRGGYANDDKESESYESYDDEERESYESYDDEEGSYDNDQESYGSAATEDYRCNEDEESFSDESNSDLSETGLKIQHNRRESIPKFVKDRTYVSEEEEERGEKNHTNKQDGKKTKAREDKLEDENLIKTYNDTRGKQNDRLFKDITTGDSHIPQRRSTVKRDQESSDMYKTSGRNNKNKTVCIYNWKTNSKECINQYGRSRKPTQSQPKQSKKKTSKKYGLEKIDQNSFPTLEKALNFEQKHQKQYHTKNSAIVVPQGGATYSQIASKPREQQQDKKQPETAAESTKVLSQKPTSVDSIEKSTTSKVASRLEIADQQLREGSKYPQRQHDEKRSMRKKMKHQEPSHEYNSSFSFEQLAARVKNNQLQIIQKTKVSNTDHPIRTIAVEELENRKEHSTQVEHNSPSQVRKDNIKEEDVKKDVAPPPRNDKDEGFEENMTDEKVCHEERLKSILKFCFDDGVDIEELDQEKNRRRTKETKETDLFKNWMKDDALYYLASTIKTSSDYISNTLERRHPLRKTHWTPDTKMDKLFWNRWSIADDLDYTFPVFDCVKMMRPLHYCQSCRV